MTAPPRIDKRTAADLVALIEGFADAPQAFRAPLRFRGRDYPGLRQHFVPEWRSVDGGAEGRDFGLVLDRLFARLMTILIEHINRIPEKHFAAFLDRVGAERRAGTAARVPVTFIAPPALSQSQHLRRGTQVATTQIANVRAVIFETRDSFELTGARLAHAAFLDPRRDRWVDLTPSLVTSSEDNDAPRIFVPGADEQRVEHALYLAHDALLAAGEPRDVTVRLEFVSPGSLVHAVTWEGWDGKRWVPIASPNGHAWPVSTGPINVLLNGFSGSEPLVLGDNADEPERAWIRTCLDLAGLATPGSLPRVQSIFLGTNVLAGGQSFIPEEAFANSRPIDLGRDFYPFTERPSQNDVFYICSPMFHHQDPSTMRTVTVQFKLVEIPGSGGASPSGTAVVTYEYPSRNGGWQSLTVSGVTEVERSFRSGVGTLMTLSFDIEPDFITTTVNGSEGAWIRLRIATGDYGHDTVWLPGPPPDVDPANYTPPFLSIADFRLRYSVSGSLGERPQACRSQNHFEWTEHPSDGSAAFTPIVSLADRGEMEPSMWLGYDRDFGGASISQLLVFDAPDAALRRREVSDNPPKIAWDYLAPTGWQPLSVQDDTQALSNSSTLAFPAPVDWGPASALGHSATWLRARQIGGIIRSPRRLLAVHPNSVWAESTRTFEPHSGGKRIGSGSGERGQRITVSAKPLRASEILRVREPNPPAADTVEQLEEEERRLASEFGVDPVDVVRVEPQPGGDKFSHWVRWYPVANRRGARPEDRKYVIDRVGGTIEFPGMAVPRGRDNIRFDFYEVDTGERAREAAVVGKVNQLVTSLPFVSGVFNHLPAEGGSAPERLEDVLARGPTDLKHRGRAVTREDFEALARVADTGLAIARAYPVTNADGDRQLGAVTVLVVPDSPAREPQPSPALTDRIRSFLQERASGTAVHRVYVIGPTYRPVSLSVCIVPSDLTQASTVAARVAAALETYLHPLHGGRHGGGWGFGAEVCISDVYAYVESLEGVEYAVNAEFVEVDDPESNEEVLIPDTQLLSAGSIDVVVATGTGGR